MNSEEYILRHKGENPQRLNEEYIQQHREEDVRALALRPVPKGVDAVWCLQQIEGWQLARKKLPRWAATAGLLYPPRISMEQCSSEATALYKQGVVQRLLPESERTVFVDFTGGLGIDFSYMAQGFQQAIYVERQQHLCEIARHNLVKLKVEHLKIENMDAECFTKKICESSVFFLDPARRDNAGRKVAALEDCSPNVLELKDGLLSHARYVILKLSPMLDITQAIHQLSDVREVHVVSVHGECKELLLVLSTASENPLTYHCVNLETDEEEFVCSDVERHSSPTLAEHVGGGYLFEPNASILKAGVQDAFCQRYGMQKLHPMSNLFTILPSAMPGLPFVEAGKRSFSFAESAQRSLPGRLFVIDAVSDFSKSGLKSLLAGISQANLTIRNFPTSVAALRKKLKLKEGGSIYLFATTLADGSHCLVKCHRA